MSMESLFSVGDKVVCVDSSLITNTAPNGQSFPSLPLVEGKSYIIKDINQCSCGNVRVDVGFSGTLSRSWCMVCRKYQLSTIWWFNQTRFIKPETDQALSDEIQNALNEDIKVKL